MKMSYIARKGYQELGWRFFAQGLGPTMIRAFPSNAAVFLVYEACLSLFNKLS